VHTSLFTANMAGQAAARLTRVPVLSTFTQSGDVGLVRSYQPGAASRKASALRAVANRIARSQLVRFRALTTNAAVTNLSELRVPANRVRIIPRGVETAPPMPDPETRRRLGLPAQSRLVVNVGRQAAQKGQRFLLEAFELLATHEADAHLIVLGREGDASAELLTQLAASTARDRVHFLGFRRDARSILGAADLFLFSSLMEGLGTAVLEAMAARVPVVAFDIPPVREITDSGRVAHLVPVGDAGALGTVALAVLRGEEPDRVGIAHEWVEANYDIDHIAASLRSYLETVAGGG
jgi:glycosyltransferase involved in cell wall biosynthesis